MTPYGTDCEGGLTELDDIVECMVEAQRLGLETIDDLVLDVQTLPAHLLNDSYESLYVLRRRVQDTLDCDDYLLGQGYTNIWFTPQIRAMTIREWLQTVRTSVGPVHMHETWT